MQQNTQEWLDMRKNYLGASDAPIVMGVSPWRTKYQLWLEKLGLGETQPETAAMRYGKEKEAEARTAYELYTGNIVFPEVIFHKEKPFMMASLDGYNEEKGIAVEIKCANKEDHQLAKQGKVPEKYYPQLQHQLACLDFNLVHYYSYHGGEGILVEVPKDESYFHRLYKEEAEFWTCVQTLEAPKLSDRDYIELTDQESIELVKQWESLQLRLSDLQQREKQLRQQLIEKANGCNMRCEGVKLTKIIRKGSVDYTKITQIKDVDLEAYRKEPVVSYRITK